MGREFSIGDVLNPRASPRTMVLRGLAKRCPRCGGGHVFRDWFRMHERCPTCGYRFEREEGFFFGAYIVNFVVTEAVLFAVFLAYIAVHGADGNDLVTALIVACVCALAVPLVFYPFSRTLWAAVDLAFTPLELEEILEAAEAVADPGDDAGLDAPADEPPTTPSSEPAVGTQADEQSTARHGPHGGHGRRRGHHRARRGPGGDGTEPAH